MMNKKEQIEQLLRMMTEADRAGASQLAEEILAGGTSSQKLLTDVLNPALIRIGRLWGCEAVSLSQTFVAAKIAEDILMRCTPDKEATPPASKGTIVIGNIEDDFHSLGRRIVSSFLKATGWEVHDIGNDVLAEDFIKKALEVNASVIGVSAMMQTTALNIRKLRDLLDERSLSARIKLAVGGAVFNWRPELMKEVGGDGTATNAAEVDTLFQRLQTEVKGGNLV